jgi:Protein of unknown function (DUF3455)
MNRLARSRRALVVGILAAAATLSMTQVANADAPAPTLPPNSPIAAPAGNKVFLVGHATGVQIYTCDGTNFGTSSTPQAKLFDDKGKLVATHFGGPTGPNWQATDGSTVVGLKVAGVDAPDPTTAIQWLLLSAKSTAPGPKGGDEFVKTTYIQRVKTTGGLRPNPATCNVVGQQVPVPYTADYYFWMATNKKKGA